MIEQSDKKSKLVDPKTYQLQSIHLSIIKKIIAGNRRTGWSLFPDAVIYSITIFVFRNPLRFKCITYRLYRQRLLVANSRFLLRPNYYAQLMLKKDKKEDENNNVVNKKRNQQISAFIVMVKQWKAIHLSQQNYNQVLMKGRHFINFMGNIKLFPLNHSQSQKQDPFADPTNYQKRQRQKAKYHYLISDQLQITHKCFDQIWKYEKDKRINMVVIKSFIHLMSKHIVIVKIQENYNTTVLGCEGKYVYVQNRHELTLNQYSLRSKQDHFPWLQFQKDQEEWQVGRHKHGWGLSMYKECHPPFNRKKQYLLTTNLTQFRYDDIWVDEPQDIQL